MSITSTSTPASSKASARRKPVLADAHSRGDAQAALLVLAGIRIGLGLLHVLDGDEADAAIAVIDHQQLLQPVLVQQLAGLAAGRRPAGP